MTAISRNSAWMIAALILSGVGIWLAGTMAMGPLSKVQSSGAVAAPVKLSQRPPRVFPAAYTDLAAKGLTDFQIRWIISDYQKAVVQGENLVPGVIALTNDLAQRRRQANWYLDALEIALDLDLAQRSQARQRLAALAAAADPRSMGGAWLAVEDAKPAKLCQLNPGQLAALQAPLAPESAAEPLPEPPQLVAKGGTVLPFTPGQLAALKTSQDPIEQVKRLHPAQLELLLLFTGVPPELASLSPATW